MHQIPAITRLAVPTVLAFIVVLPVEWEWHLGLRWRAGLAGPRQSPSRPPPQRRPRQKPTVVLVHGAFADASGWNDVASRLVAQGYTVYAPPNPLRGLTTDSEYLAAFLTTIDGPIVLVGHSYGGAVITTAATGNAQVKALVYVAAYALAEGENVAAANELGGGQVIC